MISWLAGKVLARKMARLRKGEIEPLLQMDAEDVRFRFPGDNSFAVELEGKNDLRAWLQRFADIGLQIYPDEVVVKGFPWRQTICVRGKVHLDTPDAGRVYDNRYVLWGHVAWGKLRDYEVYEDTEQSKALDEYLKRIGEH
jgi:ketosteroid isomerase-like protein